VDNGTTGPPAGRIHGRPGLAKALFNEAWELIEQPGRTAEQDRRMLLLACASRPQWDRVGGEEQRAIGDWQVAHVCALLGQGALAQGFAGAVLDRADRHGWDGALRVSAYEGLARAAAVLGDDAARDRCLVLARQALATVEEDDDREELERQIDSVPPVTG